MIEGQRFLEATAALLAQAVSKVLLAAPALAVPAFADVPAFEDLAADAWHAVEKRLATIAVPAMSPRLV